MRQTGTKALQDATWYVRHDIVMYILKSAYSYYNVDITNTYLATYPYFIAVLSCEERR